MSSSYDVSKLKEQVLDKLKTPTNDVFSIEQDSGEKLWVKKAKKSGSNLFHHIAYRIFKNPLLIPAKTQTPQQSIKHEASRLQEIYSKFAYVPEVIISEDEYMLMRDSGVDLRKLLESKDDESLMLETIYEALDILVEFHKLGFFHGGSQIKNFTFKDGKINMIDFEEKFVDASLEDLQFRDLFLFMISVAKLKKDFDYKKMIDTYIEKTSQKGFYDKFSTLLKSTKFLMWLLDKEVIYNLVDKDTKSIYKLFKSIDL